MGGRDEAGGVWRGKSWDWNEMVFCCLHFWFLCFFLKFPFFQVADWFTLEHLDFVVCHLPNFFQSSGCFFVSSVLLGDTEGDTETTPFGSTGLVWGCDPYCLWFKEWRCLTCPVSTFEAKKEDIRWKTVRGKKNASRKKIQNILGYGGFKYFLFSPIFWEASHFDSYFSDAVETTN